MTLSPAPAQFPLGRLLRCPPILNSLWDPPLGSGNPQPRPSARRGRREAPGGPCPDCPAPAAGLCGTFAPLCLACRISDDFGECCCAPYLPGGLHSLRTGMRERYRIQVRAAPPATRAGGWRLDSASSGLLTALSHPLGLRRARLGGPHLLFALRPLSDGAGTEDPRVKKCRPHPPLPSVPPGPLGSFPGGPAPQPYPAT